MDDTLFSKEYRAIPTSSLLENSLPPFDIYVKYKNEYVLFVKKNHHIDAKMIEKIESNGIEILYIDRAFEESYKKYANEQIDDIESSEEKILKSSKILYNSAKSVMNRLFESSLSRESIEEAKDVAKSLLKQITSDRRAFLTLMKVSSYDYYTYTHSINVCIYSLGLANSLKLSTDDLKNLAQGALLHDIGKSRIDSKIINKDGKLTEEEFGIIKSHPNLGRELMVEKGECDMVVLDIISQHHEKLDGSGYPNSLDRSKLRYLSQIVTIADIFDALTTKRSYKEAMSSFAAFSMMRSKMKNEVDMDLLNSFIKSFKE